MESNTVPPHTLFYVNPTCSEKCCVRLDCTKRYTKPGLFSTRNPIRRKFENPTREKFWNPDPTFFSTRDIPGSNKNLKNIEDDRM